MAKQKIQKVLGVALTGQALGVWFWQIGQWEYGWSKSSTILRRSHGQDELQELASCPCRKVAVAYSIGLSDQAGVTTWGIDGLNQLKGMSG